ncbi:hypothetical protein JS756_22685 [Streptomyces actuosus]|uniref:Secreted protein n=1 Tax=Streptomyces actuosus TaxID=1885 RepID=A0ABS2VUS4_STRAS|nr:hypothetical protein [Streptomyces actuosus]MBN0046867.1 hypothetical protein [Streptomyces actuosus]
MFRGKTARTLLPALAAALLVLQVFAPSASFASAHTSRHAEATTLPDIDPWTTTQGDESDAYRDCCPAGGRPGTGGPVAGRDRHRHTDPTPQAPDRPSPDPTAAISRPTAPGASHARPSRSAADRSTAALQAFRC